MRNTRCHAAGVFCMVLLLLDGFAGAGSGAGAALDALLGVDDVGLVAFGDDAQGAGVGAGAALDASFGDLICHVSFLH